MDKLVETPMLASNDVPEILLGLGWLRQQKVKWNLSENTVTINGRVVKLHYRQPQPLNEQKVKKSYWRKRRANRRHNGGPPKGMRAAEEPQGDQSTSLYVTPMTFIYSVSMIKGAAPNRFVKKVPELATNPVLASEARDCSVRELETKKAVDKGARRKTLRQKLDKTVEFVAEVEVSRLIVDRVRVTGEMAAWNGGDELPSEVELDDGVPLSASMEEWLDAVVQDVPTRTSTPAVPVDDTPDADVAMIDGNHGPDPLEQGPSTRHLRLRYLL